MFRGGTLNIKLYCIVDVFLIKLLLLSRGTSLFVCLLYSLKFIKTRCNGGRWSTFAGDSALLPPDVIDFAMLPTQRFWRGAVLLLDVM